MNKPNISPQNQKDESYSSFETTSVEPLSREFTEVSLVTATESHQFYRAKRFGRWYMLKALPPELHDNEFYRQMLQKEMEILMQLQHPNILNCLGMDYLPDYTDSQGQLVSVGTCIVLEYIDGITLAEALSPASTSDPAADSSQKAQATALSPQAAERIVFELLDGLEYIHSFGITHRDLKPSNIMLTRHGQYAKIIDFSLADSDSHAFLKQPAGTPRYMAPEQATMEIPDPRNDIYSLGAIIQQMPLQKYWKKIADHCMLPIEQRYPDVEALRSDIDRISRHKKRLKTASILGLVSLLALAISAIILYFLYPRDRVQVLTSEALEEVNERIEATELTKHIDTLSHWRYLDPEVNDKILAVNAFIYEYADSNLAECTEQQKVEILCQMLDRWQQWHDDIVGRAKLLIDKCMNQSTTP